jgi:RHS repeat-associated protein
VLDYYPYGSTRINQQFGATFNEQKQYIGQYTDPETNLSYLQARYMNSTNGQFLSEDPVFLSDPKQQVLTDPQSLNSYSYANDNPTVRKDPSGLTTYEYVRSLNTSSPGENIYGHAFVYVVRSG